jgi:hypothetical protein
MTAVPLVGPERSSKQLAERLRGELREGDLVFAYRSFPESLPVYLDRTIGVSDYRQSDLTFGISHLSPEERQRRFSRPRRSSGSCGTPSGGCWWWPA